MTKSPKLKAYIISTNDDDQGCEIIFAETVSKAKSKSTLDVDSYIDLSGRRAVDFDGFENATTKELTYRKWQQGWFFYDSFIPYYEDVPESDKQEIFDKWFETW